MLLVLGKLVVCGDLNIESKNIATSADIAGVMFPTKSQMLEYSESSSISPIE